MNDAAIFVRIPGPDAPRPRPRTLRRPRATVASPALVASLLASAWVAVLFRLAVRLHRLDDRVAPIGVDLVPPPSAVVVPPDRGVGRDEGADLGGRAGRPPLSSPSTSAARDDGRDDDGDDDDDDDDDDVDAPRGDDHAHVVFSTDCSGYQHWQSIASYYSLRRAGHAGRITRVASGCSEIEEDRIRSELRMLGGGRGGGGGSRSSSLSSSSSSSSSSYSSYSLGMHFTPSHSLEGGYKYSNKPGGILDWIVYSSNNRNTTSSTEEEEEEVVALVDPDMLALRPVVSTLGGGLTPSPVSRDGYRDLVEYADDMGKVMLLRRGRLPPPPSSRVATGVAAGQHFGLGGIWASAMTDRAGRDFANFNLTSVCGPRSPCLNFPPSRDDDGGGGGPSPAHHYTSRELADAHYAVGPVYIASRGDWMELLPRWNDYTPRVHVQYPKLLAEMFAFAMAAADMRLKFALSSSYMVSLGSGRRTFRYSTNEYISCIDCPARYMSHR